MSRRAWLTLSCGTRRSAMSVWPSTYRDDHLTAHGMGQDEGHAGAADLDQLLLISAHLIATEHDPAVYRKNGRTAPSMADIQSKTTQTRPLCSLLAACDLAPCSWSPRRCVVVVQLDLCALLTPVPARQARHLAARPARTASTGPRREAQPCRSYRMSQQKSHRRC